MDEFQDWFCFVFKHFILTNLFYLSLYDPKIREGCRVCQITQDNGNIVIRTIYRVQ